MEPHWICLLLRFEASKDVTLEMLSRRAALSGNTLQGQKSCFVQSCECLFIVRGTFIVFRAASIHRLPGFRSFVKITTGSFSSLTSSSLHRVPSALQMEYDVASLCPTCITLHSSMLASSNHLLLHSFNLSKSSCNS